MNIDYENRVENKVIKKNWLDLLWNLCHKYINIIKKKINKEI